MTAPFTVGAFSPPHPTLHSSILCLCPSPCLLPLLNSLPTCLHPSLSNSLYPYLPPSVTNSTIVLHPNSVSPNLEKGGG